MKGLPLSHLQPGQRGVLTDLATRGPMRTRLQDLGFLKGAEIRCLMESPLGDPKAYWIGATAVALRAKDAGDVFVRPLREGGAPDGATTETDDRRARGKSKRRKIHAL